MDNLSFEEAQVSAFRTHRHHLDLRAPRSRLPSVVADVCGVQAQVTAMARIALWARLRHLTVDDVEQALVQKRNIVKTWSMRGALHLLASNELLLYLSGLMPTRLPREQRWIEAAGLKEEETTAMILDALKDGPLTRVQLVSYLAKKLGTKTKDWFDGGWGRETLGSNTSWQLVRPAVMRGLVCSGPSNGQEITFTRVDRWLREPRLMPAEEEAEDALVRRHLRAFGPADAKDLWSWSGVYVRRLRVILDRLRDELVDVNTGRRRGFLLRKDLPDLERGRPSPEPYGCFRASTPSYSDTGTGTTSLTEPTTNRCTRSEDGSLRSSWWMVGSPGRGRISASLANFVWTSRCLRPSTRKRERKRRRKPTICRVSSRLRTWRFGSTREPVI